MCYPVPISPEEEKEIDEASRKAEEAFEKEHPLLSILFDLIRGLALLSFGGFWLILAIYLIFFCG